MIFLSFACTVLEFGVSFVCLLEFSFSLNLNAFFFFFWAKLVSGHFLFVCLSIPRIFNEHSLITVSIFGRKCDYVIFGCLDFIDFVLNCRIGYVI